MNKKKCNTNPSGKSPNKQKEKRKTPGKLRRINPNAAGIDVGSKEHYVAVPEGRDEQSVRTFACFTPDLHKMARWLKACNVESVAMESTGVYWIPIFEVLEDYGFDVTLVDARQVKNVPGRKTDVSDCKWIQELHSFGLLSAAFRPEKEICTLRSYWRHRSSLAKSCAKQIHLMQKALEQMNVQLHKVLSDITGMTGMSIIRAIVSGERNPVVLAKMRHHSVKVSEETIANALTGNWREEHLFALGQALELYDIYQDKIAECDRRIDSYMQTLKTTKRKSNTETLKKTKQKRRKNQPYFDLASHLYRMTGVDLTRIDGIDTMTVQTVITECGIDMSRFPTEKHFCSWLAICPNNQITGGKIRKRQTRKVHNRAADALRLAAQSLHSSKTALGAFYRRMRARLGAPKAITATAHKLAKIIYNMLKYGHDFVDFGQDCYEKQYQDRVLKSLKKRAREMGLELINAQTGELVS